MRQSTPSVGAVRRREAHADQLFVLSLTSGVRKQSSTSEVLYQRVTADDHAAESSCLRPRSGRNRTI
jgi:hypothetical protein